jgi:hypothetical protein
VTVKTLAYCDAPKCEVSAPIHLQLDRDLPPGWIETSIGRNTTNWTFCSMTCVSAWALAEQERRDQEQAIQNNLLLPRDEYHRFKKDPEHWKKKEKPE